MTFKSAHQPLCRYCAKPIQKATRKVYVMPAKAQKREDVADTIYTDIPPRTLEDCRVFVNGAVVSISYGNPRFPTGDGMDSGAVLHFSEWDGESYLDEFFCSSRCAQALGRESAAAGGASAEYARESLRRIRDRGLI